MSPSGKTHRRCSSPTSSCCGTCVTRHLFYSPHARHSWSTHPHPFFLVFSCKPQVAQPLLNEEGIKEALAGKLLISILSGVTIEQLTSWVLPSTTVIRAMPNVACRVRFPEHHPPMGSYHAVIISSFDRFAKA